MKECCCTCSRVSRELGIKSILRGGFRRNCSGQATVEYALVLFALLSIILACSALSRMIGDGALVDHAVVSASHHIEGSSLGVMADVLLY